MAALVVAAWSTPATGGPAHGRLEDASPSARATVVAVASVAIRGAMVASAADGAKVASAASVARAVRAAGVARGNGAASGAAREVKGRTAAVDGAGAEGGRGQAGAFI